jgi:hypothetical protein
MRVGSAPMLASTTAAQMKMPMHATCSRRRGHCSRYYMKE